MIKLTLKDGSIREIEAAQPASEIIKGIGMGLYKAACCVKTSAQLSTLTVNLRYALSILSTVKRLSGTQLHTSSLRL